VRRRGDYVRQIPKPHVSNENIERVQWAIRAIQESIEEAVGGKKSYDFRTPIDEIHVVFDEVNPERIMVNFQLRGMANQLFPILLDGEDDET
jgi:hypothetical protein